MRKLRQSIAAMAAVAASLAALSGHAEAATLKTLYSFCSQANCSDGEHPEDALTLGPDGTLYGVTHTGGVNPEAGTVFAIVPNSGKTKYRYKRLHSFCVVSTCADGNGPAGRLVIDTAGNLYGTTTFGGANGFGTVFELMPMGKKWKLKVLYDFCPNLSCAEGSVPIGLTYVGQTSGLPYDGISPFYGTASSGGENAKGAIFTLTPMAGKWKERAIASFDVPSFEPIGAPSLDAQGNVFVTTRAPFEGGAVTETSPKTARKWVTNTIHTFTGGDDGKDPTGGLAFDDQGRLFGTTSHGGDPADEPGDIYRLTRDGSSWTQDVLHHFCQQSDCPDGKVPFAGLTFDASGNLIGTAAYGGGKDGGGAYSNGGGTIFRMGRNGNSFKTLYAFCAKPGCTDGATPFALPVTDASGTLYGTTSWGGANGGGTVYAFVP